MSAESFSVESPDSSWRGNQAGPAGEDSAARLFERIASPGTTAGRRSFHWRLTLALMVTDLLAIVTGFSVAVPLADGLRVLFDIDQVAAWIFVTHREHELAALAVLGIGIFAFGGLYRRNAWELDEIRRIVAGVSLLALFDAMLQYAIRDHTSRLWFITAYPMVALSMISFRMAVRALPSVRQAITSHVVLLGSGMRPDVLTFELRESRANPVVLLRSVPLATIERRDLQLFDRMLDEITAQAGLPAHRLQIVLAPAPEEIAATQDLIELLNALQRPYSIVLPFHGLARHGLSLQKVIGADMVMAEMRPAEAGTAMRLLKRLLDVTVTTTGLIVITPLLLMISALLVLEGGPVFFSQVRIGRNGRRFRCYKFRTMRPDAEARLEELLAADPVARAEWAHYQKLRHDPRITHLGQFLRRTSLDELPQLFNVLLGDMSLVGPRPIVAPEVAGYPNDRAYYDSPDFAYYIRCTPGVTGLWQVSGRSTTRHDERVRLDRWYARNLSIWLDLMILLKTIRVVLFRSGSI